MEISCISYRKLARTEAAANTSPLVDTITGSTTKAVMKNKNYNVCQNQAKWHLMLKNAYIHIYLCVGDPALPRTGNS